MSGKKAIIEGVECSISCKGRDATVVGVRRACDREGSSVDGNGNVSRRQCATEVAALRRADVPIFYTTSDCPSQLSTNQAEEAIQVIRQAFL